MYKAPHVYPFPGGRCLCLPRQEAFQIINAGKRFYIEAAIAFSGLYKKMKVLETILFFAELKGIKDQEVKQRALDYLEKFDLTDRKEAKLEDLSKGNQQKVQFICTIIHNPDFIILDEPFSGLDPVNTNLLKDIILELKSQGKIIIFSTHLMDFAEKMCDHIAIIHQGKMLVHGSLKDLKQEYSQCNISLVYQGDISFLQGHPMIEKVEDFGQFTGIRVRQEEDVQTLLHLLVENKVVIKRFDANDISLHEIFINLTANKSNKINSGTQDALVMEVEHV